MLFLRAQRVFGILFLANLLVTPAPQAAVGEVALGGGPILPRADEGRYSHTGAALFIRVNSRLGPARGLSVWGNVGYDFFDMDHRDTAIPIPGGPTLSVEEQTEESAAYGHLGIQLGSPSRSAFFRPRVGVGLGLYYFWTETIWHQGDVLDEIASVTLDEQWRPGCRAIVGADLFVSRRVGISVDFKYDWVSGLKSVGPQGRRSQFDRFQSYALGVVFAFDTKPKKKETKTTDPPAEDGPILTR